MHCTVTNSWPYQHGTSCKTTDNSPLKQKVEAFIDLVGLQGIVPRPNTQLTPLKRRDFAPKIMNRNA